MTKLVLIADDLTGAADSGIQFAKRGLSTMLLIDYREHINAEVLILDTESRGLSPSDAYANVHSMASALPPVEFIYKKVDSTLRGNIGAELEAIMTARRIERAVIAPAFPSTGRTTLGGRQRLNGQLLEHTIFAQDPLCPVTDSYIPRLLSRQMHHQTALIELSVVRAGVEALAKTMSAQKGTILVVDALTEKDLYTIAQAALQADVAHLTCGSAGLADAVAEVMLYPPSHPSHPSRRASSGKAWFTGIEPPVLIIAATRNPLTDLQLSYAAQQLCLSLLHVDTEGLAAGTSREIGHLVHQAGEQLEEGYSVALSTTRSPYIVGFGRTLIRALGGVAAQLAARHSIAGLVLTGGDTALGACRALGTTALTLIEEVAPGIPLAQLYDGPHAGLPLVTKAGGFGDREAIAQAIRHLQRIASGSGGGQDWTAR